MTLAVLGLAIVPALDLNRQERLRRHTGNRFRRHLQILPDQKAIQHQTFLAYLALRAVFRLGLAHTNRAVCGENPDTSAAVCEIKEEFILAINFFNCD